MLDLSFHQLRTVGEFLYSDLDFVFHSDDYFNWEKKILSSAVFFWNKLDFTEKVVQ